VSAEDPPPEGALISYLGILAGTPKSGQFFDVRWVRAASSMRRRFVSALCLKDTARMVARLARHSDVYVGVALRDGSTHGGKSAIGGSHLLYIECDDPDAAARLAAFPFPPTMEVASGSPGGLQLYWRLQQRAASLQVESANRRLALALRGDPASVDIARLLRPPSSLNYKHSPPVAVRLLGHNTDARYALRELTGSLPQDPHPGVAVGARSVPPRAGRTALDRELLAIPAAEYVRVLAGLEPTRAGKVLCPFHTETDPSLQLYPDGTFYCFGSGCRRGGTIYDFAAHLWLSGQAAGASLRGRQFVELRERLAARFNLNGASCSQCS
jgi:hypothetical protein